MCCLAPLHGALLHHLLNKFSNDSMKGSVSRLLVGDNIHVVRHPVSFVLYCLKY